MAIKSVLTRPSKASIYCLLALFLAFNFSSHTFAYWPGDSWWLRSAYWLLYLLLALSCILGFFHALHRAFPRRSEHLIFALAVGVSWIPFGLAITMLDIATARPEIAYVHSDLHRTGFLPTLLPVMLTVILPKHCVFGALIYLCHFYVHIGDNKQNDKPGQALSAADDPNTDVDTSNTYAHQDIPLSLPFMQKMASDRSTVPLLLQAQEHYLKVTTAETSELILYRFGQAISEVPEPMGLQVHRSYWVARENVKGWYMMDNVIKLAVHHGDAVPVSRRFEQAVKQVFEEIQQDAL